MRDRVEGLVGRMVRVMWVMTFHSACARILRTEAERLGYTKRFSIYDDADSVRLVRRCLDELSIDPKRFAPRAIKSQISRAKNQLEDAAAYRERVSSFFEQTAADVYELYEKRIHEMNAIDFDDLLFRTVNLLELFPDVARALPAARSAGSWWTSTRTPTTRSTGCSSCSPARSATCAWSATTTSRSTASAAPTSATSSTSSATFPARTS